MASLKIGGDIRCEDASATINTAVISVTGVLKNLSVGGSIIGEANHFARILVGGVGAEDGAAALKTMTVKYSVLRASIAPGWDGTIGLASPRNLQAGIGSITIGGDMTGSFITSGGTAGVDGIIGNRDDGLVAGGKAGIASLKVVGALTGIANDSTEYSVYSRNILKVTIGKATCTKAQLAGSFLTLDSIGEAVVNCPS